MINLVQRLSELIGYPERVAAGAVSFAFLVDGEVVEARQNGGALLLVWRFPENAPVQRLAELAPGRILREEAVLAWDAPSKRAILWQVSAKGADDRSLVATFQEFLDSRDWWMNAVGELTAPKPTLADLIIRP